MAFDLALDTETGDLVFSPNLDFQPVLGDQVVAQRIWTRLRIEPGWINDPTGGQLGSTLRTSALRINRARALNEVPLMIRQALSPMSDVEVNDVQVVEDPDNARNLIVRVHYTVVDVDDEVPIDVQSQDVLSFSVAT